VASRRIRSDSCHAAERVRRPDRPLKFSAMSGDFQEMRYSFILCPLAGALACQIGSPRPF